MKLNHENGNGAETCGGASLKSACAKSCRNILAQITRVKEAMLAETRLTFKTQERLLRLALSEAEAMAWQTAYPHLFFPALATEKVQAIAAWNARQRSVRQTNPIFAPAP
jgi:hypothetical protein